ncbi:hypothetical protein [Streptomyces parvus]|uniref:hypothetical protein n=1 Tax=Streptomyces parvus TaxID=66428 RepID=UPI0021015668|nr:hypothetical protein [Streptomyces parvus]MCQ1577164.1 hypothetical protein [Streptomyces parvus]
MIPDEIQTGNYGIGAFFPLVVLDAAPHWQNQGPGVPPLRCAEDTGQLLAVRWCAPESAAAQAPSTLARVAATAPPAQALRDTERLAAFRAALPQHLNLIALTTSSVIGPWSQRPGRPRAATPPSHVQPAGLARVA